jgi:pimeloyl-ACP methyl ester carboxylesterase
VRFTLFIAIILIIRIPVYSQTVRGFVPINEGTLYYERTGNGPPLVFLHGVCLDHRMWQPQMDFFAKNYTCINIDLRGFGLSSVPTQAYSFHDDINLLLDSLHIHKPVTIIALSMGGKAAVNFALAYPEKTKALVLADVAVDGYSFRDFLLGKVVAVAQQEGIDSANRYFLDFPAFATAKTDTAVFNQLKEMLLSYSGWQWVHKNPIQGLTPPAIQQLGNIKIPVLIITGENDIWDFQQIAGLLHEGIPQSEKKEIPGAGHLCNLEKPAQFNKLVAEFLTAIQ